MTPGDVEVRPAREEDLAALPTIELAAASRFLGEGLRGDFLDETTPIEELREAMHAGMLWVAVRGGTCVGFAHASMLAGGEPWLEEINVHPDHGRRGIGRALVLEVARWARTTGATVLGLTTFRDVAWNAPFYRRLGFRELAPAGLLPSHREILDDERRRGLPMERRVLMRLNLAAVAPET